MMGQGNSLQMMVMEGSRGKVAGEASTLAGNLGCAVDGACAMSRVNDGWIGYRRAGATSTMGEIRCESRTWVRPSRGELSGSGMYERLIGGGASSYGQEEGGADRPR